MAYENQNSIYSINGLGRIIKNFCIFSGISQILAVITIISFISSLFNGSIGLPLFFAFILIIFTIVALIISIIYLINLNNVKNDSQSPIVGKIFNLNILSIAVSFILGFTIPNPNNNFFITYVVDIPSAIISIIIVIKYLEWFNELNLVGFDVNRTSILINHGNLMKIGAIISLIPFIGFVGQIIYLINFYRVGKELEFLTFTPITNPTQYSSYGSSESNTGMFPNYNGNGYPTNNDPSAPYNGSTEQYSNAFQSQTAKLRCPICGELKLDDNSKFCANCGFKYSN